MFGNIGWGELFVLMVAALVILGPERLPGAVAWSARSLRQVREYATGASKQLKDELGPEFDDLRKPLAELRQLKGMTPRAAITKHLLDGDDSYFTGDFDKKTTNGGAPNLTKPTASTAPAASSGLELSKSTRTQPLTTNEKPPFDADAT